MDHYKQQDLRRKVRSAIYLLAQFWDVSREIELLIDPSFDWGDHVEEAMQHAAFGVDKDTPPTVDNVLTTTNELLKAAGKPTIETNGT